MSSILSQLDHSPFMTRRGFLGLTALSAGTLLAGCASQGAAPSTGPDAAGSATKIKVAASFYPMYDFASKIGGDRVDVTCLVPAGTEPHEWEPSTADMRTLGEAKLLVYNGAGMEHWVDDTLASLGGDVPKAVEASKGADLLKLSADALKEEQEEEQSSGGDPSKVSDTDPHCWLSPRVAKQEMSNIRDGLVAVDPDGASTYDANYETWAAKLDALDEEFRSGLDPLPNKSIVVSHEAFGYLCHDFGLTQMPIEGIEADAEPDAQAMAKIVDFVKAHGVKTIFSEELVSPKVAQSIADATGAKVEVLNPLEGLSDEELAAGDDYFSVMRSNLDELKKALS
nr:metal ABC transporter substrate-binding protein [Olsenella sp. HMSC062G07]